MPDNVLTPLIAGAAADNYFMSVSATREDEAPGDDRAVKRIRIILSSIMHRAR